MRYIKIKNKGEIEPAALYLLGGSSKVNDDSKIGQFGSGNKFALAYLLRNDYEVKIFAGGNEITITTEKETFRDNEFEVIFINSEKTSITTQMGKDWDLWQALREVYCNALDEGECTFEYVQEIHPIVGETHFYIQTKKDIQEFVQNFDNYFATNKKVLFECSAGRILEKTGEKANIYRKGIKCFDSPSSSIYDYDFASIQIDENRIASYSWEIPKKIWDIVLQCDDEEVLMNILHNCIGKDMLEANISEYSNLSTVNSSDVFKKCIKSINIAPESYAGMLKPDEVHNHIIIPTKLFQAVRPIVGDDNVGQAFKVYNNSDIYREIELTPLYKATLDKALDFLKEVGFEINYPIIAAIMSNKDYLAIAWEETIILSDLLLEQGVNEVVNGIIEENTHLKYNVKDKTRAMQTALITELISYMKKSNAYAI